MAIMVKLFFNSCQSRIASSSDSTIIAGWLSSQITKGAEEDPGRT